MGDAGGGRERSGSMSSSTPQVKIGHYILGETLGIGTFGKVKVGRTLGTENPADQTF